MANREPKITQHRGHVDHLFLVALLEKWEQCDGKEDLCCNVDLELCGCQSTKPGNVERRARTCSSNSWGLDLEIPSLNDAPAPIMTPALLCFA